MVEGPGVRLNAEKLRRSVLRKQVRTVSGPIVQSKDYSAVVGLVLGQVLSLGKELFLLFSHPSAISESSELCLRLHFGMNGSLALDRHHKFRTVPCFQMDLDDTILRFYETTVEFRDAAKTRERVEELCMFDVCSDVFNAEALVIRLRGVGSRPILDAVWSLTPKRFAGLLSPNHFRGSLPSWQAGHGPNSLSWGWQHHQE